jgi:hypothetical protein
MAVGEEGAMKVKRRPMSMRECFWKGRQVLMMMSLLSAEE